MTENCSLPCCPVSSLKPMILPGALGFRRVPGVALVAALALALAAPVSAQSASGTWTNPAGGSWATAGNWAGGVIADGSGHTADFSTLNLSANAVVTLDGARSIGTLVFGDSTPSHNWTLNPGSGGALTLATGAGQPTLTVTNQSATVAAVLAGTQGLRKTGSGRLLLSGVNTY
ncbi:MAG: hypothetical protein NTW21_08130, partial [Verrucomicrobia bacterium]|nr:hypothetical protein [Verrucomicrobiota bacterium]